jgi:GNAT superfamily N-acetyltransferase
VKVRAYQIPDDVEGLSRVLIDSATYHRGIDDLPPMIPAMTMDYARQRFTNLSPDEKRLLLLAEVDGEVVGLVEATMRRDDEAGFVGAYVDELAVAASWRGRGVGTLLMAEVDVWALGKGAMSVALDHLHTNEGAHRLYSRLGYAVRGVIMEKRLRG